MIRSPQDATYTEALGPRRVGSIVYKSIIFLYRDKQICMYVCMYIYMEIDEVMQDSSHHQH